MINHNQACFLYSLVLAVGCAGDILPGGSVPVNAAGAAQSGAENKDVNKGGESGSEGGAETGAATGGSRSGGVGGFTGGSLTGGRPAGGAVVGGTFTGGASTGGLLTGGTIVQTGGVVTGGTVTGGVPAGGARTGGASSVATGGVSTGGVATGGVSTGGVGTGGSAYCDEATAIDLGTFSNSKTSVQADGCAVVTSYPSWWGTATMYLRTDSGGTYPVPFVWENACSGASGEGTLTGPYTTVELGDVSDECATLIDLDGPADSRVQLYWQNSGLNCLGGEYISDTCQAVKLADGDKLFDVAVDETYAYFVSYQENGYVARVPLIGGDVTILAEKQNGPARIAVNDTHVFWTNYLGGTVNQMSKAGGPQETIGTYTSPLGIEVDDTHVYWADNTNGGTIYRKPLSGGDVETLANTTAWPWGLALDGESIYYTVYDSSVYSVPLIGGSPVLLAESPDYPTALTMNDSVLFWVSRAEIQSVTIQGGAATTLVSGHKPYGIAVKGDSVYFTDENEKAVLMVPKTGGDSVPVATGLGLPRLMTTDEASVLWADFGDDTTQGGIYRLAVE